MLWIIKVILYAISALTLLGGLAALVHAIGTRPDAFPAVDTKSKGFWVIVLALSTLVCTLIGAAALQVSFLGIFYLAGVIAICVYLADVRPRTDEIQGKSWFRKAA